MWEVPLEIKQSEIVENNILVQTTKPELAQYLHATLFIPKTTSLLKAIKLGLLETYPGLAEGVLKKHQEKFINATMVHLHTRRQGLLLPEKNPQMYTYKTSAKQFFSLH